MREYNQQRILTKYLSMATRLYPLVGRKYTLTHSDQTGQLFLSIGNEYDTKAINHKIRDEVLAEWTNNGTNQFSLNGMAYISGGEFNELESKKRYNIFLKEMPTALFGIVNGDKEFYLNYPFLLDSPIYISFKSIFPEYNQLFYFGTPRLYMQ